MAPCADESVENGRSHAKFAIYHKERTLMKTYNLRIGGESFEARIIEYTEFKVVVDLNGDIYEVELAPDTHQQMTALMRPPLVQHTPSPEPSAPAVQAPPEPASPAQQPPQAAPERPASGPATVTAPIPGVVKQILVSEGDSVAEGQALIILEAMKMENTIAARAAGKVSKIHVSIGDAVQEDQLLVDVEGE
jgi:biotin carboxyl carrier protein